MTPIALAGAALLLLLTTAGSATPPTAPELAPQAVVERLFASFNRHDLDAMASLYSSDAELTSPDFCAPRRGPEGVRKTYRELFEVYPDILDHVTDSVVQGDRVAVRFVARSDAAAFELHLATFFTIRHGRIVRDATYFDTKGRPCS
jgi:ketosteroid isomerase-like protein